MLFSVTARRWLTAIGTVLLIAILATCTGPGGSVPSEVALKDVWARPAKAWNPSEDQEEGIGNGAVFLRIVNGKEQVDRLVGAQASVAAAVEIHETLLREDMMSMQQVEEGIIIPAGGEVELKPGGYHIMLIGLKRDLEVGDQFPVTLQFKDSGSITAQAIVREP